MNEFRPLNVAGDIDHVNGWMQQPHALAWWHLEGPRDAVRD